jgi:hypothetical protein
VGQEGVLLGLVEAVNFVDEDYGTPPLVPVAPSLLHHLSYVGYSGHYCAQAGEVTV